jgi:hypothetical protein|tara:strand:- start:2060 stop:3379 length:1320 start_codon:yes stop_codon:yes gene_type:complete
MPLNIFQRLKKLTWNRDSSGNNWYVENNGNGFGSGENQSNLEISQNHPILTPALLFISKLFSQAEFKVVNKETGKEEKNHWLIKLLNKPNLYQTQSDFLESLQFIQIAQGKAVGYLKRPIGFSGAEDIDSIYLLDSDLIEWPLKYKDTNFRSPMLSARAKGIADNEIIKYDENGENLKIKVKDLIFFYDLPNMLQKNFYDVNSRLDGLRQTLINTNDSLIAKNIILKTNGKELISGGNNEHFPLAGDDKEKAENLLQNNYGLGWFRKRGIVTKASINYQSLHIALRDLGLDESVKVDGNLIYTALHIPKDIISLEAKKTTYNNFKESMVSYIQNEMQASTNAFADVLNQLIDDSDYKLVGSYEHLPIMQFILIERYEGISKKAKALNDLLITGVPKEVALEMCGFDKDLQLEEIQVISASQNSNIENNQTQEDGEEQAD